MGRIEIIYALCRNEMIVGMRDLVSDEHRTYTSTSCSYLYCRAELLRYSKYSRVVWLWYICEVIDFYLRDDESMTELQWRYIEKCIDIFILIDFIGWDFSGDDARK